MARHARANAVAATARELTDQPPAVHPPDSLARRVGTILQAATTVASIVALILVVITSRNEANDAKKQAAAIQQERYQAYFNSCQTTNQRHDATVRELLVVLQQEEQNPPPGFTHANIQSNLNGNLFLIGAFEPRTVAGGGTLAQQEQRGCTRYAEQQTHPKLTKQAKRQ